MKQGPILTSLLLPFALLLAGAVALVWLFGTASGLHWAYAELRAHLPGTLDIKTLDGTLAGPIHIADLTYRNDAFDVRLDSAQIAWSPAALLIGRLRIGRLEASGLNVKLHESGPPRAAGERVFAPALNVSLGRIHVERIGIERQGHAPFTIHSVELSGFIGQQLARVDRFAIDAPQLQVHADGTLGLIADTDQALHVDWRAVPPGLDAVAGSGQIGGNLYALTLTQQITQPIAASVHGEVRHPFSDPRWRLDARVAEFDAHRLGLRTRALRASLTFDASGGRTRFDATGTTQLRPGALPSIAGDFVLNGSLSGDRIVLDRLALQIADTETHVIARADWRPRETAWQATAQWQHLRWPLTGTAAFESPQGTIDANGTYENYRLKLDFATTTAGFPSAQWRAVGTGDRRSIAFTEVDVDAFGTTLHGAASASWSSPRWEWRARIDGRGIDPSVVWPDWPGSLALRAHLSGDADSQHLSIDKLQGKLRGQPLSASATVLRQGADYPRLALNVASGKANAVVNGGLDRQWNLSWRLSAPDLGAFLPHATGALSGSGTVIGPRLRPRIVAQASGTALAYTAERADSATINATIDLSDNRRSHLSAAVTHGVFRDRAFERIAVAADGYGTDHTITVDAQLPGAIAQLRLQGTYTDRTWSGTFTDSTIRFGNEHWTLDGHPKLVVSRDHAALGQACWHSSGARTCFAGERSGDLITLSATAREMPFGLLTPLFSNPPEWQGTVSGKAELRFDAGRLSHADMALVLSPGKITSARAGSATFAYQGGAWNLRVDDSGLHATARITLPGGDGGSAEFAMPRFRSDLDLRRQPISGKLSFGMHDVEPLGALLTLEDVSGALQLQLTLDGTLDDPRVRGDGALTNVAARIPAAGIRIHDTGLVATADGTDEIRLRGQAYSGASRLDLSGRVVFPEGHAWHAELHLTGDRFYVADLRETQVYVSPDLHVKLDAGNVDVTGDVRLPKASFVLRSTKADVVATSPDVVIVDAAEGASAPPSRWTTTANIHVLLGDDVTVSAFGLNGKIAGDVTLIDTPARATTARGELRVVKGQYEAYSQKLDVERGRLAFVGGPVNNPTINARASRKIDQITVGVEVTGTLQSPRLTLFSDPAMSQSDTLSYLLFGRPLQGTTAAEGRSVATAARALKLAGGERLAERIGSTLGIEDVNIETGTTEQAAALVLGKQLSPRLYINYSIGLFTPANVLHLKYKLGQRWSLEAQSGAQAGGDIIYTIEK